MSTDFYCPSPWTGGFFTSSEQKACCSHRSIKISSPLKFISGDYKLDNPNPPYGSYLKDVKYGIISGNLDKNCQGCKDQESQGIRSLRQVFVDQAKDLGIPEVRDPDAPTVPQAIEVRLSNLCNFKCRMCYPMYSSLLDKEVSDHPQLKKWFQDVDFGKTNSEDEFLEDIITMIPQLKWINLTGGEPMILPSVMDLIDEIIRQGYNSQMSLHITTNCSTINPRMLEQFTKFKRIQLTLSLDGVNGVAEYIRHGTIWDKVNANFNRYGKLILDNANIDANINIALTAYSILDIDRLIDHMCGLRTQYGMRFHMVLAVGQLHYSVLTGDARQRAIVLVQRALTILEEKVFTQNKIRLQKGELIVLPNQDDARDLHAQLVGIKKMLETTPENEMDWNNFKSYTKEMDDIRGENFESVFGFKL
jgi:sulfatase maturation enzyme AslB (radical SAM superfamily)